MMKQSPLMNPFPVFPFFREGRIAGRLEEKGNRLFQYRGEAHKMVHGIECIAVPEMVTPTESDLTSSLLLFLEKEGE
jgi:hypothetical protein